MCLYPVTIKTKDSFGIDINQSVPCGKCIECLKDRQNSWKIRLQEEARDHKYVYFFTLTYRDDTVPFTFDDDGNKVLHVRKSDIQLWIKRHRISYQRYFKRDIDFKYFICSEYGPNTGRPHYHGIIFTDISPTFISSMFSDWSENYGFTNFSEVGKNKRGSMSSVGNYVAKYCLKPAQFKSDIEKRLDGFIKVGVIPKTFYLMSKGIGKNYIDRMKRYHKPFIREPCKRIKVICDRAFYHDGVFKYKLPRYYRDRLYRRLFPCDSNVWNPKLKLYEKKIVYRYKSQNPLAIQVQNEIRGRILADYNRRLAELQSVYPSKSVSEVSLLLSRSESSAKMDRFKNTFGKMSRFYNYNKSKVTKL